MSGRLTHILAASALAATLAGSITTSAQAIPLPVTSAQEIAGATPTEQIRWWGGRGWGGWGWRGYGGGIAAGAIAGGLLGLATGAAASSYYGYGYPSYGYGYSYPSYSYGYYPSYYGYSTASYAYPSYYGYSPSSYYGGYWTSGRRV